MKHDIFEKLDKQKLGTAKTAGQTVRPVQTSKTTKTAQTAAQTAAPPRVGPEQILFYRGDPAEVAHRVQDPKEVRQAIARGETVRPASWQANEDGMEEWGQELDRFVAQAEADSTARDGVWQDTSAFEDYRQKQTASMVRFRQQASRYRDFFDSHRDIYGDQEVDSILKRLDRGTAALSGLGDYLREEGTLRGQFADRDEFDTYQRLQTYDRIPREADFGEKSRYQSTYRPGTEYFSRVDDMWYDTGYGDIQYDFINRNRDARNKFMSTRDWNALASVGMAQTQLGEMTDQEIAVFNYLYAQDEARGDKSHSGAYQYIRDLNSELNARQRQGAEVTAAQFAQEHPVLASVGSVLASPMRGVSYLGQAADYLADGKIDQNAGYNQYSYIPSAIRGQRSQDIEEKWGKAGSFLYNTGMSMGDFLLNAALGGGIGQGGQAAQALTLGIMGTGAAADTVISKKDMGYDDTRAFALGTVAGAAEILTEKFSLETLLDKTSMGRSAFGYFMKNVFAEASEEGASDIINWTADELYDVLSGQSDSEWKRAIRAGEARGLSRIDAEREAFLGRIQELGLDMLGGGLSGGVMAGGNMLRTQAAGARLNAVGPDVARSMTWDALQGDPDSEAYRQAQNIQQRMDRGKRATNWQTANLYQALQDAAAEYQGEPVQTAIRDAGGPDPLAQAAREMVEEQEFTQQQESPRPSGPPPFNKGGEGQVEEVSGRDSAGQPRQSTTDILDLWNAYLQESDARAQAESTVQQRTGADISGQQRTGKDTLAQAAEVFGENGRKAFAAAWDGQGDSAQYYAGFSTWYQAGLDGKSQSQVRGPYAGSINEAQRVAAYNSGQRDAAASLAKEKAAAPYARTAGTEAGLVYDEYVAEATIPRQPSAATPFQKGAEGQVAGVLTAETAERINNVARELGVRVRFVDSVAEGRANGQYSGSDILIAKDAADPVAQVFGHEITHRMQELAPEQYRTFRQTAMENLADSAVQAKIDNYRAQGETIQYEAAMDEAAADYAGQLLEDGKLLDEFIDRHRTDRTLLQKLRDVFRGLWQKLTGAERRKAQTAEGKLSAALDAAAEQAKALTQSGDTQTTEGEVKYSIKYDRDNTPYVIVETDILKDVPQSEWARTVKDNLRKRFPNGITVGNNVVRITRKSWGELTHSKYTMQLSRENPQMHSDKLRATDSTDEIIQTAQNWVNEAPLHPRSDDIIDFARGTVQIRIGGNDYTADVVVGNRGKDGLLLYDIIDLLPTQIQERTEKTGAADTAAPSIEEGQHDRQTAPITHSVPQPGGEVKPRFSLKTDSTGRELSQQQQEFFKDSKVRDGQGRLKTMYQGGPGGFTVFDRSKASGSNLYGRGFYFTDSESHARQYGQARAFYLNIQNPVSTEKTTITKAQMRQFLQAVAENDEDYSFENYGYGATVDSVLKSVFGKKSDFAMLSDVNTTAIGDMVAAVKLFNEVNGTSYDGLILPTETVAFDPEQIKSVDNENPTKDPDIRYSLKGTTITKTYNQLLKENDALRERLDYWRGQTRTSQAVTTDRKAVTAAAKALIKDYGVQMDAGELTGRLQALYDAMASGKTDSGEIGPTYAWEQAEQIARDIAGSAVSEWSLSDEFPGLKEKLRTTRLSISHEYDNDIHNENFRREYRGKLNLTSREGTNVDAVYQELAESYPGLFPEDITHPAEQMEQIMDVADSLHTVEQQSRFSGQMEEAVTGITGEIMEGFFDLPQTRATMADRYEAKLDEAKAHGKQRVAETREQYQARMQKLRQENRQAVRNAIDRERATRQRQLQALKDRYAQSRENARGRRADSKARDRLLHIVRRLQNMKLPEVNRTLLNEYIGDLDTVAKSMTGQTLAKLENLRDWYAEQKANNPDFIADPKIERDLERLSKRQIGDLSAQEVADLTQVLLNIENEIRTQRKLIDSQERRDVYAAGEAAIRDIEASAGSRPTGLFAFLDKNIVTETLSPLRQVRRMTGYAPDSPLTKVTQELADGQRAMMDYQMKAEAQFSRYTNDKAFTRSFAGPRAKGIQIQGLGKDGPVTVTITPAMRASLYLHSLNDQNLRHIRDGGITVPDWKLYQKGKIAEAYDRGTIIKLTPSQVRSITAHMTQKERAFALAAHRYFNVTSKEAVNAVSEKLKGYSIAQVEDYFPIHTDSSFTRADFESVKFDGTIEGMGFLKERVNAANPILLRDMSAELDQSIQLHSKYVGLAVPVRNFNKLWNVTTGQWVDGDSAMDYNGDEGGGTDGLEETAGYNRRGEAGEGLYADAGGVGADASVSGGIAEWAANAQIERPEGIAREAVKTVRSYGVRAVVVQDAAIKARNPNAMALTEGGVVYLSDALTEEDASVGHHEAVHAVKQRGSAAYESFLDNAGGKLNLHSQTADYVLKVITNSRFDGQDLLDLTPAQQRTVFDELNALVWGCYKADAKNARAQFQDVFTDYDGYITALGSIMEAEKTETQATRRFQYEDSVKNAVKNKWGEAGYGYIEKMMSDLQNGHAPTKPWSKAMSRLRSNYAGAVLTLNASVAMKQAASYPTAAAVLGWGPLNRAMLDVGKVDLDLIAKYTPLQWYRSKGFSTQELGDMKSANRQLPTVLNWVQGVDLLTTRKLWKASEYYVRGHNKALNPGTDAYYRAVADIYNQVIEETQPNYTTMQRPQLLRSDDSLLANLQMFKTQPFQNFNIVYDAAGEFTAAMRRGDKAQIKTARAKLGRAVTSQLAQLAVFAGMGMAWAMFRGKKKKYEDEDGELTTQSMLTALGKDMVGGALSGIPFGSDAWELLSSKLFGDAYYGMDAVTVQALSDTIQSLDGMGKLIESTIRAASAGEKIDWRSAGIKLDGYIDDISKAAGVPYENVANLVYAIQRQVAVQTLGEIQGEYAAMKWTVDPEKKSGEYYDLLYKALERGDLDSYFTIREELPELLGKDHSDIDGAMKSRYTARVKKDPGYSLLQGSYDLLGIRPESDSGEKEQEDTFGPEDLDSADYRAYVTQRAEEYREAEEALAGNPIFKGMDQDTRNKVLQAAYDLAKTEALVDASDGQYKPDETWIARAPEAERQGIEPWEYALWRAASTSAASTWENGKEVKGETRRDKIMDWLGQSGLSEKQQEFLWGTVYTNDFGEYREDLAEYRTYGPQMDAAYGEMTSGLEDNPIFQGMDAEIREKVTNAALEAARQMAQAEAVEGYEYENQWIATTEEAQTQGIAAEEYVMWPAEQQRADRAAAGMAVAATV